MKYWVWIDCSECPPDSCNWDDGPFDTREEAEAYGEDYIDALLAPAVPYLKRMERDPGGRPASCVIAWLDLDRSPVGVLMGISPGWEAIPPTGESREVTG